MTTDKRLTRDEFDERSYIEQAEYINYLCALKGIKKNLIKIENGKAIDATSGNLIEDIKAYIEDLDENSDLEDFCFAQAHVETLEIIWGNDEGSGINQNKMIDYMVVNDIKLEDSYLDSRLRLIDTISLQAELPLKPNFPGTDLEEIEDADEFWDSVDQFANKIDLLEMIQEQAFDKKITYDRITINGKPAYKIMFRGLPFHYFDDSIVIEAYTKDDAIKQIDELQDKADIAAYADLEAGLISRADYDYMPTYASAAYYADTDIEFSF